MTVDCPGFVRSANPRIHGCARCGRVELAHATLEQPEMKDPPRTLNEPAPNTALYVSVGRRIRVNLKDDDGVLTGRVAATSPECWWLVSDSGSFRVLTGRVQSYSNL